MPEDLSIDVVVAEGESVVEIEFFVVAGGCSVWQLRVTIFGPTKGSVYDPLRKEISNISRKPCNNNKINFNQGMNLRALRQDCWINDDHTL